MGKLNAKAIISMVVLAIVGFTLLATLAPTLDTASDSIAQVNTSVDVNGSGFQSNGVQAPFSSLFASGGLVILIFMAGMVLATIAFFKMGGR